MRALYCDSDLSFLELLKPMFGYLDSLYWIVESQGIPLKGDWLYEAKENKRVFENLHVNVPAFDSTSAVLWRPGSLSKVGKELYFDEWCLFIGFESVDSGAVSRATRIGTKYFSREFYESLAHEGGLLILWCDGWWEFYSGHDDLLSNITSYVSCREIVLRAGSAKNSFPKFK